MTAGPSLHIARESTGVDIDDVTTSLEEHGLDIFDASWRGLSEQLAAALRHPAAALRQPRENHPREKSGN